MAIKLNGVEITSNKLNSSNVTLENLDGVKVFPTAVPATGWAMVGATNDYIASFEQTGFLIDPSLIGCGYNIADLPSASLYLVGDIVRGRTNPISGNPCDTWVYYEAIGEEVIDNKKWVLIGEYTSKSFYTPFYHDTSSSEQPTAELMEQKFPASNYNVGHFGEIQWWDTFYVFQVQEV